MDITHIDYLWKQLTLKVPTQPPDAVRVLIRQPQGYCQEVESPRLEVADGVARVTVRYPLLDDGRYDPPPGVSKHWLMGSYEIEVTLLRGTSAVATETLTLDPNEFFPLTYDRPYAEVVPVDSRHQVLECAPRQHLYLGEPEALLLARTKAHRVPGCDVLVDVVPPGETTPLAGPWRHRLGHQFTEIPVDLRGWKDGEYWARFRMLAGDQPIGSYCVRKFWLQAPQESTVHAGPVQLDGQPELLVDGYCFAGVDGIRFTPDEAPRPDGPVVTDEADYESEGFFIESMTWNQQESRYEAIYYNILTSRERENFDEISRFRMLAVSRDGVTWEKPKIGAVAYRGSDDNNIVSQVDPDTGAAAAERQQDIDHATFEFYDAATHGTVDLDQVFICNGKSHFPFKCASVAAGALDGFAPEWGQFWAFEKRGDHYLILHSEPVIYSGVGMDLRHTTESVRCHVEYLHNGAKRLLFYFRPGAPPYPPHGSAADNYHQALRCLGVVWTDDGLTWNRRFVIGPDGHDRPGTQFYSMGLLQEFSGRGLLPGRPVMHRTEAKIHQAVPRRNLYVGSTLVHWGLEQIQAPELIWTRDMIHFHRFAGERRSIVRNGPAGSFDRGMIRERYRYWDMGDEWWYYYTGVNTRHNGYRVMASYESVPDMIRRSPRRAYAEYVDTWEGHFVDGKQTRYLPGIARMRPYRLAHAEPTGLEGRLVSRPILVQQEALRLNADTGVEGEIRVVALRKDGTRIGEAVFRGDDHDAEVLSLAGLAGHAITLEISLREARLYAFLV